MKRRIKKVMGMLLPIMLICLLIPQKVHAAAGISEALEVNSYIVVTMDIDSYECGILLYLTQEEFDVIDDESLHDLPETIPPNIGDKYTSSGQCAASAYTLSGDSFEAGDVVYVLALFCNYDSDDDIDVIYDYDYQTIIIGGTSQNAAVTAAHTHSYQWVTVTEASQGQDGVEQYACSCGDVQMTQPIPASSAYINGLYGAVKNAGKDGSVDYNAGRWTGISEYVIKKLAERTDVTTKITFEYKKTSYTFTIPAGTSYEALLNDEEQYYGFFTFCNLLEIPVTQL